MVRRRWSHEAMMAMSEAEFGFWLGEQIAFDEVEAEARKKAAKR